MHVANDEVASCCIVDTVGRQMYKQQSYSKTESYVRRLCMTLHSVKSLDMQFVARMLCCYVVRHLQ